MRKVWVSREALIPKPFYKRKLFVFFVLLLLSSILFLAYQLFLVNKLSNSTEMLITEKVQSKATQRLMVASNPKREVIRGIRIRDIDNYTKLWTNQKFKCLDGSTEIEWEKINDDFCDCPDGTDETLTNSCANGKFYCTKQLRHKTGRGQDVFVPTSRINDGICDCKLDCSDEFK